MIVLYLITGPTRPTASDGRLDRLSPIEILQPFHQSLCGLLLFANNNTSDHHLYSLDCQVHGLRAILDLSIYQLCVLLELELIVACISNEASDICSRSTYRGRCITVKHIFARKLTQSQLAVAPLFAELFYDDLERSIGVHSHDDGLSWSWTFVTMYFATCVDGDS
jgi:hypothetical protein